MAEPTLDASDPDRRLRELEAVATLVAEGVITLDIDGRITGWDEGVQVLTGYTAQDVFGRPLSVLYTPEDQEAEQLRPVLDAALEHGRAQLESWWMRKDGERFRASGVLAPVRDAAGQVTGYVAAPQDVTARRSDESVFRGLLESAPDAMVIVSADGRITLVNRQAEQLFGFSRDQLVGRAVEMLVPQRLHGRHVQHRDRFFAAPAVRPMGVGLELLGVRADGSEFPIEISLSPLQTDQGVQVCAAIRDVTERRETEARLRQQRDEIMELSTPVIQVWDRVLALPIIGTLDSGRAMRLTESLLEQIAELRAEVVILDISGVPTVDTLVAQHLLKTVQAATLMGAVSILSGVRPETAQAIVHLGIDLGRLRSRNTLRDALQLALRILHERADETADSGQLPTREPAGGPL
jgi:PAS domain S-box-containing protein